MNEVSVKEVILYLKKIYLSVLLTTFAFSSLVAIYSLNVQEIYRSEALLKMSETASGDVNFSSSLSGIAQFAGINLEEGRKNTNSPEYVSAILYSRDFFKHILKFEGLAEGVFAHNGFDENSKEIIYDKSAYNSKNKKWIKPAPPFEELHKSFLMSLSIEIDKKTQFIYLSYESSSPYFAKKLIETIVKELNNIEMQKDNIQIKKELNYLQEIQQENNFSSIGLSVSTLITSLIQDQMLSRVKEDYLIEYIDKPNIPDSRIFPLRTRMVLLTTIVVFLFGIFSMIFFNFVVRENPK
tara:strand:- start:374 stop:1261 length:888 start_codon:yes stop_codon:yes gene_type:complete